VDYIGGQPLHTAIGWEHDGRTSSLVRHRVVECAAMMNRPRQDRPARDRVWVKPGEKAAAIPEKPLYDNDRLLKLLQSAKRELQGLRLVHLHLSLLQDKNYGDILEIKRAVQSISDNSAYLQIFNLSNEDVLILEAYSVVPGFAGFGAADRA
jgi:hypothetical protein